ncbi:recombinase family protein [Agathobaculum hominis]|uniref:Recombinase family protein n=1 Tax=Agathobaculum hominis TaxID=2763014 RepID=A0ABR7GQQ8_9FIRM|nr:recombinase family protein [Agathobaculum hominis]MBC5696640.1 recombinase family protein [Agathobaculum hominis]
MKGKNYYYSCVRPEESDAQAERFRALGARDGEIFIDTIGEKSSQRNNLRLLKQLSLREGDTLTVSSLYCLSDLKKGLADELHWMRDNGIQLRIADIPLSVEEHDEKSQQFLSDLMFEVFDATILKEREQRRQKQSEGIRAAKKKGVHIGRKPMERGAEFEMLKQQWQRGEVSLREAGRRLGVTHQTFKKWVEKPEED